MTSRGMQGARWRAAAESAPIRDQSRRHAVVGEGRQAGAVSVSDPEAGTLRATRRFVPVSAMERARKPQAHAQLPAGTVSLATCKLTSPRGSRWGMKWSEEKAHKNFLAKQLMPGLDGVNALEQLVYAIVDMRAEDVAKLQEEIESESAAVSANRAGAVFGPGTMLSMSVGTERTKALLSVKQALSTALQRCLLGNRGISIKT